MAALFLTIFCSTAIALILKYNEIKSGNIIILLVGNYFVATLIGFYFFQKSSGDISLFTALFGLMLSFMFVFSFFAFAKGVRAAGTALASLSARLSVLIPVILSMIVFDELPTVWQVAGLFFAVWTIVAFSVSSKKNPHRRLSRNDYFFLAALLIGIGLNDFCMKIFQQVQPMSEKPFFLLMIFGFSFFLTASYVIFKRMPFERGTALRGAILGIPNIFSAYFLIDALAQLPGIIVFPSVNVGIILGTAILAWLIFQEKLNRWGMFALFLGMVAVVLLGI